MQGTVDCAERALKSGTVALNIAGGTHHAFADRAEGFASLNDFAIAAIHVINAQLATRVLIIDCDVHQGNGSASILSHHPDIVTFSMHGASNYPLHKEESDVDIALPDGTEDGEYLARLSSQLEALIPQDGQRPDLVMYQCGVDILGTDKLGKLSLTMRGCQKRINSFSSDARITEFQSSARWVACIQPMLMWSFKPMSKPFVQPWMFGLDPIPPFLMRDNEWE